MIVKEMLVFFISVLSHVLHSLWASSCLHWCHCLQVSTSNRFSCHIETLPSFCHCGRDTWLLLPSLEQTLKRFMTHKLQSVFLYALVCLRLKEKREVLSTGGVREVSRWWREMSRHVLAKTWFGSTEPGKKEKRDFCGPISDMIHSSSCFCANIRSLNTCMQALDLPEHYYKDFFSTA